MNASVFAIWLQRQNHKVIRTASSYWVESGPRVYQAFPFDWVINPDEKEINDILLGNHAIGLRYSTLLEAPMGIISYHVVYDEDAYNLDILSSKMRTKVRKGLRCTRVEPISFDMLANQGWELRLETLIRQGRANAESKFWWETMCLNAKDLPGFEAWGAFFDGKLVAAVYVFICESTGNILYHQSLTGCLKHKVNNALTFTVTKDLLSRPEVSKVFYGLHSLDAPPSVDSFKFEMSYIARPVRQRVVFHPSFQSVVNPLTHSLLVMSRKVLPSNPTLAKAEGMFRFYLQGRLPLARQPRPEPLRGLVFS